MGSKKRIKGVVLADVVIAVIILAIFAGGFMVGLSLQYKLLRKTGHRTHAINYAVVVAEKLFALTEDKKWYYPGDIPELTRGLHTEATDPHLCRLPDTYFKNKLKGNLEYTVEAIELGEYMGGEKVTIKVTWQEGDKEEISEETLVVAPAFGEMYF